MHLHSIFCEYAGMRTAQDPTCFRFDDCSSLTPTLPKIHLGTLGNPVCCSTSARDNMTLEHVNLASLLRILWNNHHFVIRSAPEKDESVVKYILGGGGSRTVSQ